MTMGNKSSKIRQMPSTHSVIIVALLLIPIRNGNIPLKWMDEQLQTQPEMLNETLQRVLQRLTLKQVTSAMSGYYTILCANGNFRF
jgi:hypothetical protein